MAKKEHDLTTRDAVHEQLMRAVLNGIDDTPLVLKGGTALLLAYGLDRFSEDLDFDAPHKLNLESRIRRNVPHGITLAGIDTLKDTGTVTRYRVRYQSEHGPRSLKLEISYRTPTPEPDVRTLSGLRVASLPRILDQKLNAAHDGDDPRTKVRDLYDLDYIARRFPAVFDLGLASRLVAFSEDPDSLISRYRADFEEDDLLIDVVELETLVLGLHCNAPEISQAVLETTQRIDVLPSLKNTTGAAYSFWRHADAAIKTAKLSNGCAREVNWQAVEEAVIHESISEHEQSTQIVFDVLCKHSPGAATRVRQQELHEYVEKRTEQSQIALVDFLREGDFKEEPLDTTSQLCVGAILWTDGQQAVQSTGRGQVVIHDVSDWPVKPEVDKVPRTIQYKTGVPALMALPDQDHAPSLRR